MARTAVITGTASATVGAMNRPRGGAQPMPPPQAAPAPAPAPGAMTAESIEKLKQLGELRTAGVLTEAEFAEAKARLLA